VVIRGFPNPIRASLPPAHLQELASDYATYQALAQYYDDPTVRINNIHADDWFATLSSQHGPPW